MYLIIKSLANTIYQLQISSDNASLQTHSEYASVDFQQLHKNYRVIHFPIIFKNLNKTDDEKT